MSWVVGATEVLIWLVRLVACVGGSFVCLVCTCV